MKGEKEDFLRALTTKFQVLYLQSQRTISESNTTTSEVNLKPISTAATAFQKAFNLNENLVAGTILNHSFIFPPIPAIVKISEYSCALWQGVPTTGTLYASEGHLCFSSPFRKGYVILPFHEIVSVQKESYKADYIRVSTKTVEVKEISRNFQRIFNSIFS
jgi:hypothetical protein